MGGVPDFDIVVFGATGFTGALTAEYLAHHAPDGLRWALAGRSPAKLEGVRDRLAEIDPGLSDLALLHADVDDAASLAEVAGRTRVVATTVGPYLEHGEPLVAACAAAGTDYVDLTGEGEFTDRMWLAHHETAVASGARIVHACGFDSIPYDLGVFFTVPLLPPDQPITVRGVVRSGGSPSGGTFATAMEGMARVRQARAAHAERRKAEGRPVGRSSRAVAGKPHRDPVLGYWLLPMPTVDPLIVARSGAALASYGPDFRYSQYAGTKTLRWAVGGAATVTALGLAAQVKPLRGLGEEPVAGRHRTRRGAPGASWFTVDFVAESAGTTVHTRVKGGDPGYGETATMLAESALCLAFDDNPATAGQVTTAQAMGEHLLARLQAAGITFEVRD